MLYRSSSYSKRSSVMLLRYEDFVKDMEVIFAPSKQKAQRIDELFPPGEKPPFIKFIEGGQLEPKTVFDVEITPNGKLHRKYTRTAKRLAQRFNVPLPNVYIANKISTRIGQYYPGKNRIEIDEQNNMELVPKTQILLHEFAHHVQYSIGWRTEKMNLPFFKGRYSYHNNAFCKILTVVIKAYYGNLNQYDYTHEIKSVQAYARKHRK